MGDRIEVDRDEWEATQQRLRELEAGMARVTALLPSCAPDTSGPEARAAVVEVPEPDGRSTSRRKALIGMAGAAAGAAALVAGQASPAAANGQGQSWTLGDPTNTATNTTGVTATLAGGPVVSVRNGSAQRAILGVAGSPSGNGGTAAVVGDAASTDGVFGLSGTGRGVAAISTSGAAVAALSVSGTGVEVTAGATGIEVTAGLSGIEVTSGQDAQDYGTISSAPAGVVAQSSGQPAVIALSDLHHAIWARTDQVTCVDATSRQGPGVRGVSTQDVGVLGISAGTVGVRGQGPVGGVVGRTTAPSGSAGVYGEGPSYGVEGRAVGSDPVSFGVRGESNSVNGAGVAGQGSYLGVRGNSAAIGVQGTSFGNLGQTAVGVLGVSENNYGLAGRARVPLHLFPSAGNALPDGVAGNVWVAANGTQWACVGVNQWRVVAGTATAGALHVLAAPARVYDSRPGTAPTGVGPKTRFAANETRTFDLKANGSTVPAGARAALVTLLLVNASTTAGNATIWANGVTKPLANSMVWGGTAGRFTATATTAMDRLAVVQVNASQPTDLVIDVVGYYR